MLDIEHIHELFLRHKDEVYRLALSYTHSTQEAEDICQNVFLKLLEHPNITPGKEKAWLMQVCANQCKNLLRSHWWSRTDPLPEDTPLESSPEFHLEHAMRSIPPKYRVVLYLHYYAGYDCGEIARLLKITPCAVRTRLHRARAQLRELLKED